MTLVPLQAVTELLGQCEACAAPPPPPPPAHGGADSTRGDDATAAPGGEAAAAADAPGAAATPCGRRKCRGGARQREQRRRERRGGRARRERGAGEGQGEGGGPVTLLQGACGCEAARAGWRQVAELLRQAERQLDVLQMVARKARRRLHRVSVAERFCGPKRRRVFHLAAGRA